jgi:peptidoglycan/LPS O-acetylase OafA/YrhL
MPPHPPSSSDSLEPQGSSEPQVSTSNPEMTPSPNFPISETAPAKTAQRIDWIDSIRGLSAVFVMVLHYYHIILLSLLPTWMHQPGAVYAHHTLRDTFDFIKANLPEWSYLSQFSDFILGYYDLGKIGVVLFFIVSGFVIPFSLFRNREPVKCFFVSRFFRLYPLYWFSLLIVLLVPPPETTITVFNFLANMTMFHKFLLIKDLNGVAWTLQIELAFYGLCIGLLLLNCLKSFKSNIIVILTMGAMAMGLAIVRYQTGWEAPIALPLGISVMFMGYIWRKFILKEEAISTQGFTLLMTIYLLFVGLVCYWGYHEYFSTYIITYYLAFLLFALFSGPWQMHQKFLLHLGKISYSVYLLHALLGRPFLAWLVTTLSPDLFTQYPILIVVAIFAGIGMTLGVSTLTYDYIEKPFVDVARKIIKQMNLRFDERKNLPLESVSP